MIDFLVSRLQIWAFKLNIFPSVEFVSGTSQEFGVCFLLNLNLKKSDKIRLFSFFSFFGWCKCRLGNDCAASLEPFSLLSSTLGAINIENERWNNNLSNSQTQRTRVFYRLTGQRWKIGAGRRSQHVNLSEINWKYCLEWTFLHSFRRSQ